MTTEQLDAYKSEMRTHEKSELSNELKAELSKAQETLKEFLATEVSNQLLEKTTNEAPKDAFKLLEKEIAEKVDAIKTQKGTGTYETFTLKAVGGLTVSGNMSNEVADANVVALTQSTGRLYATPENNLFAESIVNSESVSSDFITWIDEVDKEGNAGMTAEGAKKSQSDFTYVERNLALENVTHFIKVSTKMLSQPAYIVQAVRNRLLRKLALKKQQQILSGTGTAPEIKGIKEYATAFVAGSFATSVADANLSDLIRVLVAQIAQNADDFMPNYVIMSHKRLADMDLDKASDGHYILPPFATLDNRIVAGVRVIASNEFTDDELLVGDFSKANYVTKNQIGISIGLDGDDFTKNMRTLLVEQMIGLYVSSNETGAFILVDDIDAAILAITAP